MRKTLALFVDYHSKTAQFLHPVKYIKWKMRRIDHARHAYLECSNTFESNLDFFSKKLGLQEDFDSWFSITVLHMWMYNCRLRMLGQDGSEMRQELMEHFFLDLEIKLAEAGIKTRLNQIIQDCIGVFNGNSTAYDEGLYHGDAILAAALYRNVLGKSNRVEPEKLYFLVEYVRKQLNRIETESPEPVLESKFKFNNKSA